MKHLVDVLSDRPLLRFMDRAFEEFIEATNFGRDFHNDKQHDMFYWEHRSTASARLSMQDQDAVREPTVVYSNHDLLKWLVSPSRPNRILDRLHLEIIRYLWPEVLQIPLSQKTSPKQKLRKLAERAFFTVNRF